jgi:hypothetical protein
MYALVFILSTPAYLGNYHNLHSCENAIRQIYAGRLAPVGQPLPELDKSITLLLKNKKEFICIPVSKD